MNAVRQLRVPPLVDGDHLTAAEFMHRYEAMPEETKAELIQGVVYMSAAAVSWDHGKPHAALVGWLAYYWGMTPGVEMADNSTTRLLEGENVPQPDAMLRISEGGLSAISADRYVEGPPELVAEISLSSVKHDLSEKLEAYEENKIPEYIVWNVAEDEILWHRLTGGKYKTIKAVNGIFKSKRFPGLWLDVAALLKFDMAGVFRCLREGIATPEHQRFVAKLAKK